MRRTLVALTAVLLAAVPLAGSVPAAQAATATISGTITAADTGQPVPLACLVAYPNDGSFPQNACSDSLGRYQLTQLSAGVQYQLHVWATGPFLGQWARGATDQRSATSYAAPATVDFALARGVQVSGTVRDTEGSPVAGASVGFQPAVNSSVVDGADTTTTANGTYTVYLAPGDYGLTFWSPTGRSWYAHGKYDLASADPIHVAAGTPLTLDDTEPAPTLITGHVTDAATGRPLPGICTGTTEPAHPDWFWGQVCTDASGAYSLPATAGTWLVLASDPNGTYAAGPGSTVTITNGRTLAGIDLTMTKGGTVTGTVVDRVTGTALSDICPTAYDATTGGYLPGQRTTCSDAGGAWSVGALPGRAVTVKLAGDQTHVARWASDADTQKSATPLTVTPGGTTDAGTVRLYHGGTLTGRITDPAGKPVADAWVLYGANYASRAGGPEWPYAAQTAADGTYTMTNVPAGNLPVEVFTGSAFAAYWSGGESDPAKADPVRIGYDRTTRFDAELKREAKLQVTVSGVPAGEYVVVDAYTHSGAPVGISSDVFAPGPGTISGLPESKIKLKVTADVPTPNGLTTTQHTFWYPNATSAAGAKPIEVHEGRATNVTVTVPAF
ncbi:MAG TPA: carboxypeptidase-like regulatory domain-containing protein [Kineosporiaceae bacterium]|nr:carboxypeptidase-like regulatory domain-containing protein [Kineosporiaceae bacterium]